MKNYIFDENQSFFNFSKILTLHGKYPMKINFLPKKWNCQILFSKLKHCQLRDVKIHIFSKFHQDTLKNKRENEKNLDSKSHETYNRCSTSCK